MSIVTQDGKDKRQTRQTDGVLLERAGRAICFPFLFLSAFLSMFTERYPDFNED